MNVVDMTEHEHRDRELADDIAERGRFTIAGESRTLGLDPDWHSADLPEDEEWRIEWVKFGWGLDLAHAGHEEAWRRLTTSWIAECAPGEDAAEVTARRVLNWIYAGQRFGALDAVADSLARQAEHVRANLAPARNHRTLELYALLIAGLAFPELDTLDFALTELDRNLATDFHPDGVHREASTHYHAIALRSFVGARANLRRHGLAPPEGFDDGVARAQAFLAHCTRPDGTIPALSDADTGDYSALLPEAPPTERNASFRDGGYHVQRSGWDADARFLIFDCGPLGDGGHGHYDLLSFEAHGDGRPLVLDPGRGSYSEAPPNRRRWFRSTAAHNTVTVDGLDQTPYTRGRPHGPTAQGRLLERTGTVLAGEARSPAYEAVHTRRITFVDERRWVIEDELRGDREHRYDLRFHLPPGGDVDLRIEGAETITTEPGWIAPRYGEYLDAPVVSAVAHGTHARFVTELTP
jgi:uncharacterized heparinase superfamily protein